MDGPETHHQSAETCSNSQGHCLTFSNITLHSMMSISWWHTDHLCTAPSPGLHTRPAHYMEHHHRCKQGQVFDEFSDSHAMQCYRCKEINHAGNQRQCFCVFLLQNGHILCGSGRPASSMSCGAVSAGGQGILASTLSCLSAVALMPPRLLLRCVDVLPVHSR